MVPAVLMDTLSGRAGEWSSSQASSQEHPRLLWGPEAWVLLERSAGQPWAPPPRALTRPWPVSTLTPTGRA